MGDTMHGKTPFGHHRLTTLIGPRTTVLVGSCVLVMTAYTLGFEWLASKLIGVPMGLWAIGLAMLFAQYRHQMEHDGQDDPVEAGDGPAPSATSAVISPLRMPRLNLSGVKSALPSADRVSGVLELVGVPVGSVDHAKRRMADVRAKVMPNHGTLRIGVDLAEADARELIAYGLHEQNVGVPVEWVKARSGLVTDVENDMAAAGLDVLIRRERRGDINIFVAEHPERPAAWPDWGQPLPLGYAGVFPPRVDPARVVLAGCDLHVESHATLAAQMVLACAMLARVSGRAGVPAGNALSRVIAGRVSMPELIEPDGPLASMMRRIARSVAGVGKTDTGATPGFARAAARACTACLSSMESRVGIDATLDAVATATVLVGDEPESVLRLAAVQVAAGEIADAHQSLSAACAMLRRFDRRCDADPLAFIMSEVEVGTPGRMTLGRIAAGIGLLWGTTPRESQDHIREDLMDDLAHAGWLRDRPEDVNLLKGVLAALEGAGVMMRAAA